MLGKFGMGQPPAPGAPPGKKPMMGNMGAAALGVAGGALLGGVLTHKMDNVVNEFEHPRPHHGGGGLVGAMAGMALGGHHRPQNYGGGGFFGGDTFVDNNVYIDNGGYTETDTCKQ
jgi:hypothetical protein